MNKEELAWAAGLFDGEGWTGIRKDSRYFTVAVGQSGDPFVLERFKAAVGGLGFINGPYPQTFEGRPAKAAYRLQFGSFEHAQAVIAMLWGWLSPPKREQAKRAFLLRKARWSTTQ